jgi:hypothetical protein
MEDVRQQKQKLYSIKSAIINDIKECELIIHSDAKKTHSKLIQIDDIIKILNKHL